MKGKTRYNPHIMGNPIRIIPGIMSLTLENVGCWPSLHMEFHPGINAITGEPGALGKTTILKAILMGVWPSHDDGRLAPRDGTDEGRIGIEFAPRRTVLRRKRDRNLPPGTASRESYGQRMLRLLRERIGSGGAGDALLFDEGVLKALDPPCISKAAGMLKASPAQTICVVPRRMDLGDLPEARIFVCSWDRKRNRPEMIVRQTGAV